MRTPLALALVPLLCGLGAGSALAQESPLPPAQAYHPPTEEQLASIQGPARIAVYFDRVSHSRSRAVQPGQLFEFHLVAVGAVGGLRAWEASLLLDERVEVIAREMEGLDMGPGEDSFQVGLGNRCLAMQEILLVSYTARVKEAVQDLVIGLAPVSGGSFDPPVPGYLSCDPEAPLLSFEYPEQAAVLNPVELQLEDDSGGKKPRFEMPSGREGGR